MEGKQIVEALVTIFPDYGRLVHGDESSIQLQTSLERRTRRNLVGHCGVPDNGMPAKNYIIYFSLYYVVFTPFLLKEYESVTRFDLKALFYFLLFFNFNLKFLLHIFLLAIIIAKCAKFLNISFTQQKLNFIINAICIKYSYLNRF